MKRIHKVLRKQDGVINSEYVLLVSLVGIAALSFNLVVNQMVTAAERGIETRLLAQSIEAESGTTGTGREHLDVIMRPDEDER